MLLITLFGIASAFLFWDAGAGWWIAAGVMYFVFGCLGVTVTFHRYLSHSSFKFRWEWTERLFILFGTLAGTGSPIGWVAVHKSHHAHSDAEGDPHGPHLGWRHFIPDYDNHVNYRTVRHLLQDKYIRFLHAHSLHVLIAYYLVLFVLGGGQAVVFLGLIPQALTSIFSVLCNFFPHFTGYRNYDTTDESHNTWWLAIPTWGDAWHNNHHAKPGQASFQHKWWEFDISGVVISLISEKSSII